MTDIMDDYRKQMHDLSFSEEDKVRMVERLASATRDAPSDQAPSAVPLRRGHRMRLVAAAVAAALCVTCGFGVAYASGGLVGVSDLLDDVFGGAPAQTEVVNKVGRPLNAVASSDGVTMSADAVICDGNNYAVVYSIRRDDGGSFGDFEANGYGYLPLMFRDGDSHVSGITGAYGSSYFYDADPSDNAIQYVQQMSLSGGSDSPEGRTLRAEFSGLCVFDGETGDLTSLASGSWNLKFKMDYEPVSQALPTGQDFDLNGARATVRRLSVSPIAVSLDYDVAEPASLPDDEPDGRESDAMAQRESQLLDLGTIVLTMKDGTTYQVKDTGGGALDSSRSDSASVEKNIFLTQIIDPADLASVTVGGTTIAVS